MKGVRVWLVLCLIAGLPQCRSGSHDAPGSAQQSNANEPQVLLVGNFQGVTKSASGQVELVRTGEQYQLRLRSVVVETNRPVHVYWVGLPAATTSHDVDGTELKYDMGLLQLGQAEQIIDLPSQPDPALQSVVLWEPRYAANLASATLRSPGE